MLGPGVTRAALNKNYSKFFYQKYKHEKDQGRIEQRRGKLTSLQWTAASYVTVNKLQTVAIMNINIMREEGSRRGESWAVECK